MRTNVNEIRLSALLFDVTVVFTNKEENLMLKAAWADKPAGSTSFSRCTATAADAANG
jgi:hypothetical protein